MKRPVSEKKGVGVSTSYCLVVTPTRVVYGRQRPSLPQGRPCSTIGAGRLNFRVRNGAGCFPAAMATDTPHTRIICGQNLSATPRINGCLFTYHNPWNQSFESVVSNDHPRASQQSRCPVNRYSVYLSPVPVPGCSLPSPYLPSLVSRCCGWGGVPLGRGLPYPSFIPDVGGWFGVVGCF